VFIALRLSESLKVAVLAAGSTSTPRAPARPAIPFKVVAMVTSSCDVRSDPWVPAAGSSACD